MKTITKFTLLAILVAIPFIGFAQDKKKQRIIDANPSLYYPFENVATAAEPLVGDLPLQFFTYDQNKSPGTPGGEVEAAAGPYIGKGALLIKKDLHIQVPNPLPSTNGERLRTYTLLYDFTFPTSSPWRALFQGNENNTNDADIFISNNNNRLGVGTPGYTDLMLSTNTWYRFVATLSFDENMVGTQTFYLDGEKIFTRTAGNHLENTETNPIDNVDLSHDRLSIADIFWIFTDEDREEDDLDCAGFAFWAGRALTDSEVAALGKLGYEGSPFTQAPVLDGGKLITVQAEDFDKGGPDVAYLTDTPATNTYRTDAVKIEAGPGDANYHLSAGTNDWYSYSVNVPESREGYDYIFYFYGQKTTASNFNVLINGILTENTKDVEFPASYNEPTELLAPVTLKPGNNVITIQTTGGNLDKFEVQKNFPPFAYEGTPYLGNPIAVPGIIEAEYFDLGGEGVAYHDNNDIKDGAGDIRIEDAPSVDIDPGPGDGNYQIGWAAAGEWLRYTIDVAEAGAYNLIFTYASPDGSGEFSAILDGATEYGIFNAPSTGDWASFKESKPHKIVLPAGEHVLKIGLNGINFDKFELVKAYEGLPFKGPHAVPGFIQAEDFDTGGEGVAFHASAPGSGNTYRPNEPVNIAAGPAGDYHLVIGTGDWYTYTIQVPTGKFYDFILAFYGEKASAGTLTIEINGQVIEGITDNVDFPASYNEPTETSGSVRLKEGENIIKVKCNGGGNLDKIEVLRGQVNYQGKPFLGEPFIVSANKELVIEAEYFDIGGREITFHDAETGGGNTDSNALRGELGDGSENVRMEHRNPEGEDNIIIGWADYGDWIAYSLNVEDEGDYVVSYVISTNSNVRKQHVEIDSEIYPEVEVRTIGDWEVWGEFSIADVKLTAGKHVLYAYYYGNFDKIKIKKSTTGIQLPKTSLPGNVYAENGILKVKDFPATASLAVYNLLGQKITSYKSLNGDVEINLPAKGIYIVKAQDKGVTSSYKVIVK